MAASAVQKRDGSGTYTFSSKPRAVQQRKKYRDPYEKYVYTNSYNIFYKPLENCQTYMCSILSGNYS